MTGITGVSLELPVLSPRFLASVKNNLAASFKRVTLEGSLRSTLIDAIAAAVFGGESPTLKTNPGVVYLRYSISSERPAI